MGSVAVEENGGISLLLSAASFASSGDLGDEQKVVVSQVWLEGSQRRENRPVVIRPSAPFSMPCMT